MCARELRRPIDLLFVAPATPFAISRRAFGHRRDFAFPPLRPLPRATSLLASHNRLRVDSAGAISLWRIENGAYVQKAATGTAVIPLNQKRRIRLAIQPGA